MENDFTRILAANVTNFSGMNNLTPSVDYGDIRLCFNDHETTSCVRIGIAVTLSFLTGIASLIRAIHLHICKHKIYHHYFVLYSICVQAVMLGIHWMVYMEKSAVIDFIVTYILACQILVLCHHYCGWAAASLHHDKCFKFITIPFLVIVGLYFTGVLIWAGIAEEKNRVECHGHQWIMFSVSNFLLAQLFLIAGIYITRFLVTVRNKKKCFVILQVWGIIAGYEVSTLVAFAYDLYLKISAPQNCSQIFSVDQGVYVAVFLLHRTLKYFIPAWSAVGWINPSKAFVREGYLTINDDDSVNWARNRDFKSAFIDSDKDAPTQPLMRPTSPLDVEVHTPYSPSPRSQGYGSGPANHRPENPSQAFSKGSSYDAIPPLYSTHRGSSGYVSYKNN